MSCLSTSTALIYCRLRRLGMGNRAREKFFANDRKSRSRPFLAACRGTGEKVLLGSKSLWRLVARVISDSGIDLSRCINVWIIV